MTYYKIIDDKTIYTTGEAVEIGGKWVSNATEEMLLADGWLPYQHTETLEGAIRKKVKRSNSYADSLKKVSLYGVDVWRTPAERDNYTSTLHSAQRLGQESVSFMGITLTIEQAIHILDVVNVWAFQVTATKEAHAKAIQALTTIEEVDAYNFRTGYPDKIVIGE